MGRASSEIDKAGVKEANFSNHAKQRIGERCSLSQEEIKRILDNDGSVVIHLQKGGRYAHRLLYSLADEHWFMVVQDGGDGGVLTVMPLEFLEGRTSVTAAHKRQARKRAFLLEKKKSAPPDHHTGQHSEPAGKTSINNVPPLPGWRIQVFYVLEGRHLSTKLQGRTLESHGSPSGWQVLGPVHHWVKTQLIESSIPLTSIISFVASRGKITQNVDCLLENLPMTDEEISQFR
jgi:hypothetical protein